MLKMSKLQSRIGDKQKQSEREEIMQWQEIKTPSTTINRRSCHSSCMYQDRLYIYGGYDNSAPGIFKDLFCYSFDTNQWEEVKQSGELPGQRHSHCAVEYKGKMFIFGGMYQFMENTNRIHCFDFEESTWSQITTTNCPPPIDSHKCCLYGNQMIVGLGYSQNDYNSNVYSLDLDTLTWAIIFTTNQNEIIYPEPRNQASFFLYKDKIFIYGGKASYNIFGDLWSFDLKTYQYSKMVLNTEMEGRFGHSTVIDQDKMYIFGGTRGVTHERNDLIVIDLGSLQIMKCWNDTTEERRKNLQKQDTCNPLLKKSRRDSAKKGLNWSIFFQDIEDQEEPQKSPGKYRTQLKQVQYYNQLYKRPHKQNLTLKKTKKNPLLKELGKNPSQNERVNLNATFELLTSSIMVLTEKGSGKQQKNDINCEYWKKIPKARDNSTADLRVSGDKIEMLIFGGGMHKIGFNDLIKIDLQMVNSKHLGEIDSD